MKTYKVPTLTKVLMTCGYIFAVGLAIFVMIYNNKPSSLEKFFYILVLILGLLGIIAMYYLKVNTDDKKIEEFGLEFFAILLGKESGITYYSLNWDEIDELKSVYVLYPESPIITLVPKTILNKKPLGFMGMPIELIRDILFHLPSDCKVNLYPYLKRKLEGKQTWFYKS